MINQHLSQFNLITVILTFVLLVNVQETKAQSSLNDETVAVKENNIICYAAKKQWVCAPADDKEKAQQKAMKLALVDSDQSDAKINEQQVEIKTLDTADISQQLQQEVIEDPVLSSVKDFTPRKNAVTEDVSQQASESVGPAVVSQQNDKPVKDQFLSEEVTGQKTPTSKAIEPVAVETGKSDFNLWQSQYAEQWTFQVVGTSNRHKLNDFVVSSGLDQSNYSIVKTQANGADWWIVLSGLYSSRETALSQRNQLPNQLSANAWVRQIKSIEGQAD